MKRKPPPRIAADVSVATIATGVDVVTVPLAKNGPLAAIFTCLDGTVTFAMFRSPRHMRDWQKNKLPIDKATTFMSRVDMDGATQK